MKTLDQIYLRVTTLIGTFHLPQVYQEIVFDTLEVSFNWIVFERDMTVLSYQPFAKILTPAENGLLVMDPEAEDFLAIGPESEEVMYVPLEAKTEVSLDDEIYFMEANEIGCFTSSFPLTSIAALDPLYLKENL